MYRSLRHHVRRGTIGVALTAIAVGATSTSAAAQPTSSVGTSAAISCGVAEDAALRARSTVTPEGHRSHEAWIAGARGSHAVRTLWTAVTERFGENTKTNPRVHLERGLIGVTLEHATQTLVVMVDPAKVDSPGLQRQLTAAARAADAAGPAGQPAPDVRVQAGCFTSADLLDAQATLAGGRWHPQARTRPYAFHLDPADSTYHVTLHPDAIAVGQALRDRLGARVTIETGLVSDTSRTVDGEPHWGGAAIGRDRTWSHCTSGFTVVRYNGQRASVTAGHCFNDGDGVFSGNPVANRWEYFGFGAGKEPNYPLFDMMRIESTQETYGNYLWVDPCCPNARRVTGKFVPAVGGLVCHSGKSTRAICGLRVTDLNGQKCNNDGCTPGLMVFERNGDDILSPGDSGGPVYTRQAGDTAHINGMNVAAFCLFGRPDFCTRGYAEMVTSIELGLSVTVATN